MHSKNNEEEEEKDNIDVEKATSTSSHGNQRKSSPLMIQVVLITLYVCLWTADSLFIHTLRDVDYEPASVTLVIEIFKFAVASTLYFHFSQGTLQQVVDFAHEGFRFGGIGVIYCFYNLVRYYALSIADPGTYRVLINFRIASTGILYQVFFNQKLGQRRWLALLVLTVGCIVMKWGEFQVAAFAIMLIGFQAFLGSLSGVYSEVLLKKDMSVDINVQNMYLYIFTISSTLVTVLFMQPSLLFTPSQMFRGWSMWMIPPILFSGGGGFMTGLILKYASVLTKEYANGAEMLLAAILSSYLFGYTLETKVFLSIAMVTFSVFMFYWEKFQPMLQPYLLQYGINL